MEPKTELTIMTTLFYKFLSETGRNSIFGGVMGSVAGLILKRPKFGLFGGIGLALGLTMCKYDRLFAEVKQTKQFPIVEESHGVNYFIEKAKAQKAKLFHKKTAQ